MSSEVTGPSPDLPADDRKREIVEFLIHEAELLDDRRFEEWLELIEEDIEYQIPVRAKQRRSDLDTQFLDDYHLNDNYDMLATRIRKLKSEYNWIERPPSGIRRFISNVRVAEDDEEETEVKSNLLVYILPGHWMDSRKALTPIILSGERQDTLRFRDGSWRLADRTIYLDSNILPLEAISVVI